MLNEYRVDLHLHTCLSPCADLTMVPSAFAEKLEEKNVDWIAITDHNTCRNVPVFSKVLRDHGIEVIAGMEVQTREEVHVLLYFESYEEAFDFETTIVMPHMKKTKLDPELHGYQLLVNEKDEFTELYSDWLGQPLDLSTEELVECAHEKGAVVVFAHIFRRFGVIHQLGIPPNTRCEAVEICSVSELEKAKTMFKKIYQNLVYEENPYKTADKIPSYEELLKFSKRYFTPANMIISVVSPAAPQTVQELFSGFSAKAQTDHSPVYSQRIRLQHKPKEIEKAGGGSRSYLFWGFSKEIDPADRAALKALSLLLGEKIIFDIREKQGMAYHMSAGIELTESRALFYISQGTRPKNVDILVPQYPGFFDMKMLDDFTEADLEKAINMYLGRMMFRRLSSINQGFYLGTSLYFHNDIQYDSNFLEQLKTVKLSDVLNAAKKYMIPENPVSVIVK